MDFLWQVLSSLITAEKEPLAMRNSIQHRMQVQMADCITPKEITLLTLTLEDAFYTQGLVFMVSEHSLQLPVTIILCM